MFEFPMFEFPSARENRQLEERIREAAEEAMQKACRETAECLVDVLKDSLAVTPVKTGKLRRSGYVSAGGQILARGKADGTVELLPARINITRGAAEFTVGFSAPHAIRQHECLYYRHKRGGAKFLEKPWMKFRNYYIARIKESVLGVRKYASHGRPAEHA